MSITTNCNNCGDTLREGIYHIPDNEMRDGILQIECIVKGLFTRYNNLMEGKR